MHYLVGGVENIALLVPASGLPVLLWETEIKGQIVFQIT